MEEHLPLHLGQAKVERKREERRKTMSKVLIASRSDADCDMQVVAEGIYSQTRCRSPPKTLTLTFDNLARPLSAKNDFQKTKNFPFFKL